MSLFNPYVLLGVILALLGSFGAGYYSGEQDEYERQQIEIAALNAKARETENRMGEVAQTYAQTLRKANNVAKAKENKLRNDIVNSKLRLFIPVQAPECAIPATADAPAPAGDTETRAELDPRIAESLVDLTSRGDQAIRSLNACIDQYEQMRSFK
jgi:prophage endopeptidase